LKPKFDFSGAREVRNVPRDNRSAARDYRDVSRDGRNVSRYARVQANPVLHDKSLSSLVATVALVGQPNVGKSVVMNLLTGAGAVVSNYPGTTVEVTEATMISPLGKIKVIDTPGTYSLHSDTEEQKVTQMVLLQRDVDLVINVVDARTLARNLYLTLQLLDLEIPIIVALNQMDMARELGMEIDVEKLAGILGVPVIPMVASKGEGLSLLKDAVCRVVPTRQTEHAVSGAAHTKEAGPGTVRDFASPRSIAMTFSGPVEEVINMLVQKIKETVPEEKGRHRFHPPRALAIHLMEHDSVDEDLFALYPELAKLVEEFQVQVATGQRTCGRCFRGCAFCPARNDSHPVFLTCLERTQRARQIASEVVSWTERARPSKGLREWLEGAIDSPASGIPILVVLSYLSFRLVASFMGLAEEAANYAFIPLTSLFTRIAAFFPPRSILNIALSAVPEGILLPFSVVMPAMVAIYSIMAILEDTGLLSRIAVALDRPMSVLGMRGQGVIPLLLGFGCRAPAIMATRTLPDRESRVIVSTLLAITVPCAASLGIITGVGSAFGASLPVIYSSMTVVFVILGPILTRRFELGERRRRLPLQARTAGEAGTVLTVSGTSTVGEAWDGASRRVQHNANDLLLEIPPLRWPVVSNVLAKSKMRLSGFFSHVLPLLVVTSIGVRLLLESGVLSFLSRLDPVSRLVFGIRGEGLLAVAVTVVQRYMAPMVLLNLPLTAREATIAGAMVSLSMPCLPVSILIGKELGWGTVGKIMALALGISLGTGAVLNLILP